MVADCPCAPSTLLGERHRGPSPLKSWLTPASISYPSLASTSSFTTVSTGSSLRIRPSWLVRSSCVCLPFFPACYLPAFLLKCLPTLLRLARLSLSFAVSLRPPQPPSCLPFAPTSRIRAGATTGAPGARIGTASCGRVSSRAGEGQEQRWANKRDDMSLAHGLWDERL